MCQELHLAVPVSGRGNTNGHAVSALIPALGFSWGIKSAVFSNVVARLNDLTKEAMLQAIKDQDLRFLSVWNLNRFRTINHHFFCIHRMTATRQSSARKNSAKSVFGAA